MPNEGEFYKHLRQCVLDCLKSSDADGSAAAFSAHLIQVYGWPEREALTLAERALSLTARIRSYERRH
jgi:hypothetical protein